jgi:hypothetical protein
LIAFRLAAASMRSLMNPSRLRDFCTSALALFVAVWLCGGQSMVLQVTAWSGMIVTRSIESGMTKALTTTFDGKHPCALCTAIKDVESTEDSKSPAPVKASCKLKVEASLLTAATVPPPDAGFTETIWADMIPSGKTCDLDPPVPPPRLLA